MVSILVLVDAALRRGLLFSLNLGICVSILVLVDAALRHWCLAGATVYRDEFQSLF